MTQQISAPRVGGRRALARNVCLGLGLAGLGFGALAAEGATRREWVAHSTDSGNWSEPGNWKPAGVPQNGDDLIFEPTEELPSPLQNMVNDLVDLHVGKIEFCTHGWMLAGNELTLLDRVGRVRTGTNVCGAASSFRFDCDLKLGNSAVIDMYYGTVLLRGNVDLNGHDLRLITADTIIASGSITGIGNVFAVIDSFTSGSIRFEGSAGNTFDGMLIVSKSATVPGEVVLDKQSGAVVNGSLLIRNGAVCKLARPHQINDSAGVCVTGGAQFLLEGHTETIGSLYLTNSIGDVAPSLVDTGDATLSVQGDIAAVNDAPGVIPTIRGMLGFPGAAAAPSGAQKATSASSRWVKGNSSPRKPASLIK